MAAPKLADPEKAPSKTEIRLGLVQILETEGGVVFEGFNHVFWDTLAGACGGCFNTEGVAENKLGEIPVKSPA